MSTSWDEEIGNDDEWSDCDLLDENDLLDVQDTKYVDRREAKLALSNDFLQTIQAYEAWERCTHPADFLCLIFESFDISEDLCDLLSHEILDFLGLTISEAYCFACLKWKPIGAFNDARIIQINRSNTNRCLKCVGSCRRPVTSKVGIYHEECYKCHQLCRVQDLTLGLCVGCSHQECITCGKLKWMPMFEYGEECLPCLKSKLIKELEHEEQLEEVQWIEDEISRIVKIIEKQTLLRCISCKRLKRLAMFEIDDVCLSCMKIKLIKEAEDDWETEEISRIDQILKLNNEY